MTGSSTRTRGTTAALVDHVASYCKTSSVIRNYVRGITSLRLPFSKGFASTRCRGATPLCFWCRTCREQHRAFGGWLLTTVLRGGKWACRIRLEKLRITFHCLHGVTCQAHCTPVIADVLHFVWYARVQEARSVERVMFLQLPGGFGTLLYRRD